jgi:ABC-type Mn2+/Zn2+ transport system permease subunit
LQQYGRVPGDAAMGVVFTSLFALGVVLVKLFVKDLHFDYACVYEGSLELVPFAEPVWGMPRQFVTAAAVLLLNVAVLLLLWKELKLTSFDPNHPGFEIRVSFTTTHAGFGPSDDGTMSFSGRINTQQIAAAR